MEPQSQFGQKSDPVETKSPNCYCPWEHTSPWHTFLFPALCLSPGSIFMNLKFDCALNLQEFRKMPVEDASDILKVQY